MLPTRVLIGIMLLLSSTPCFAESTGTGSSTVHTDTGALVIEHLSIFAEGAAPLEHMEMTTKERAAWHAEATRYAERSAELRARCREEIRRANRDTIASKAAQCMRSDLLLEATHRRKQRERFAALRGVPVDVLDHTATSIDAWLDAATSVVDGIDAGVFTTIDTLKAAKRNLHSTYRIPMLQAFHRARVMHARSILFAIAARALDATNGTYHPSLEPIATCIDTAEAALHPGTSSLLEGIGELRRCIDLVEDME